MYAFIGTDYIQTIIILIGVVVIGFGIVSQIEMDTIYQNISQENLC